MRVTFFLAEAGEELDVLRSLDPDRDWRRLQRGERAWVLQTFLRMARAGHPVRLASEVPERGLVVFHVKHRRALLEARRRRRGLAVERLPAPARGPRQGPFFVAVRGDLRASRTADFEVVQNRGSAVRGRA